MGIRAAVLLAFLLLPSLVFGTTIKDLQNQLDAARIDLYFLRRDLPLFRYGKDFSLADDCGLDWRLLPAIAVKESTGGKFIPRGSFNPFGWGSGRIFFSDFRQAIRTVAKNLCGDNPATASYYRGRTTREILAAYNPPSVDPKYPDKVLWIMSAFENLE